MYWWASWDSLHFHVFSELEKFVYSSITSLCVVCTTFHQLSHDSIFLLKLWIPTRLFCESNRKPCTFNYNTVSLSCISTLKIQQILISKQKKWRHPEMVLFPLVKMPSQIVCVHYCISTGRAFCDATLSQWDGKPSTNGTEVWSHISNHVFWTLGPNCIEIVLVMSAVYLKMLNYKW